MFGSQSEIGALRKVLLHRPGEEMALVTGDSLDDYHFERPVSPARMTACLDDYAEVLRKEGVEVFHLAEVLAGDAEALAAIRRRPNIVFLRDTAAVFRKGAVLMGMSLGSRREDPWIVERALKRLGVSIIGHISGEGRLEGGGVSFLDEAACTVGLCDRANEEAVRQMAALVLGDSVESLVVLPLPPGTIHTDGCFMMVDRDLALVQSEPLSHAKARVLHAGGRIEEAWFLDLLEARGIRIAEVPGGWDVNVVCVRPGEAVGLKQAQHARRVLEGRGGRFLGFDGSELWAGCGGPHCATLPLLRLPVTPN